MNLPLSLPCLALPRSLMPKKKPHRKKNKRGTNNGENIHGQSDGFFACARSVCRRLWIMVQEKLQKSDPTMSTAVIKEQASDVVTVVFQEALSADHARAMLASLRAWPEPLQGIAAVALVAGPHQ